MLPTRLDTETLGEQVAARKAAIMEAPRMPA